MTHLSSKLLIALWLAMALHPAIAASEEARLLASIRKAYPGTSFDRVVRTPMAGVYEVWMGANVAFASTGDPRYMVFGRMLDLKTMQDLTAATLKGSQAVASAKGGAGHLTTFNGPMPIADAITVVRGNGHRSLSVFTDPACGYCRQLEEQLRKIKDVTIRYYLLPFQGSELPINIWCSQNRAEAYAAVMSDTVQQAPGEMRCANPIERNRLFAEKLRVQATPTLLFSDGTLVPGVMSVDELEPRLDAGSAKKPANNGGGHANTKLE